MRSLSRILSTTAIGGAVTFAMAATSAPANAGGDTSTAEHLFQQGLEAMKKSQFKEACDAFAGSDEADASPGTEINLALCNEKQGKLASAWGWYRTAAGLADRRAQKERAELARAEAAKLEPKLHKLVITLKNPPEGVVVTRNGTPVPHAVLGTDVPIDPGDYAIEVTAKGKRTWKQTVHIAAAPGTERLEVAGLEDAPAETAAPRAPAAAETSAPAAPMRDGTGQRNIGFVLGGAGIVAGIVAVALEFLALREKDKGTDVTAMANAQPDPTERAKLVDNAKSHTDAAKNDELGAVILGAGGIVLIGVGITLLVTAPSGPAKTADATRTRVTPLLGRDLAGVGISGSF